MRLGDRLLARQAGALTAERCQRHVPVGGHHGSQGRTYRYLVQTGKTMANTDTLRRRWLTTTGHQPGGVCVSSGASDSPIYCVRSSVAHC